MAPGTVRTIPPWVIQRPPQSLLPQHNHAPSDPRHARGTSDSSRDEPDYDDDEIGIDGNSKESPDVGALSGVATAAAARRAAEKERSPERSLSQRITTLFRGKEGRKWDHLRSSEPVIVPQFHVVSGPATMESEGDGFFEGRRWRPGRTGGRRADEEEGRGRAGAEAEAEAEAPPIGPTALSATAAADPHARAGVAGAAATTSATAAAAAATARHPWWYNPETQWRAFIESSRYPHLPNEKAALADDDDLPPDFGYRYPAGLAPKVGAGEGGGGVGHLIPHSHHRRPDYLAHRAFYKQIWYVLLHHPLGPLACRLTVLSTSIVALVLAATIFRREQLWNVGSLGTAPPADASNGVGGPIWLADRRQERTQIIVAIVVDVVAVPYIGYITVDDYTGKPLGLRPPQARIRLILQDLFFIIFKSASTALGFEAMIFFTSSGSQGLLRGLGAFELIGLISWALTLTINVFREIERLGGK